MTYFFIYMNALRSWTTLTISALIQRYNKSIASNILLKITFYGKSRRKNKFPSSVHRQQLLHTWNMLDRPNRWQVTSSTGVKPKLNWLLMWQKSLGEDVWKLLWTWSKIRPETSACPKIIKRLGRNLRVAVALPWCIM